MRQIVAGGSSGIVEACLFHPLDLVKTRLQLGGAERGVVDCLKNTMRKEGFLGLYKGILPPIANQIPKRAIMFCTFEQYKGVFASNRTHPIAGIVPPIIVETPKRAIKFCTFEQYKRSLCQTQMHPAASLALAGLASGMTEAFLVTPFEMVKVRQQADRNVAAAEQKSAMAVVREIVSSEGLGTNGIYRGLTTTMARNGIFNMIYFSFYHGFKDFVPNANDSPNQNFFYRVVLGFIAGALGSTGNIAIDVAKSPQPNAPERKYHTTIQTMQLIYKDEGFRALHKGLSAKILRLGPGGALMLVIYENAYEWLKKNA